MAQNYVIAANMAVTANEPYNASLFYEQLNALLPDGSAGAVPAGDGAYDDTEGGANPERAPAGYRVDTGTLRPERIDRYSNKPYLSRSLSSDREQWEYLRKLSARVMESLGRFASDHREFL